MNRLKQRLQILTCMLLRLPETLVRAFEDAKTAPRDRILTLVREHRLTHEMLPTEWKNDPGVWEALLPQMPQMALLRNLGKLTAVGLLFTVLSSGLPYGRRRNRQQAEDDGRPATEVPVAARASGGTNA